MDIYNELDYFVEDNMGDVSQIDIATHFFALGQKDAINKACEWLDNELPKYIMEGREGRPYISVALVDDFKKAMSVE